MTCIRKRPLDRDLGRAKPTQVGHTPGIAWRISENRREPSFGGMTTSTLVLSPIRPRISRDRNTFRGRMHNVFGLVMLIATAALLVWSSIRAWRATNKLVKWGGVGLAAPLATAVSLTSVLTIAGMFKMHTRSAPVPDLKVAGTFERIQRGQAIADSFCGACHSQTGPLTGSVDIGDHFPIPVGSFVSSNLTPPDN